MSRTSVHYAMPDGSMKCGATTGRQTIYRHQVTCNRCSSALAVDARSRLEMRLSQK